jgi:ATPase family associated with various cellular activities (AAA)
MDELAIQSKGFNLFSEFSTYFDGPRLFFAYFGKIPSIKVIDRIDEKRLGKWLESEWKDKILARHSRQVYNRKENNLKSTDSFFILDNELIIHQDAERLIILYHSCPEETVIALLMQIRRHASRVGNRREIFLLINGQNGIETTPLKLKKPSLNLALHYNDDLISLHDKVIRTLKKRGHSGLYLFHGIPGTGKSTYIRHLVCSIDKKVIFMPPGIAGQLDSAMIAKLLIDNDNTVFVIEDAEELLHSRVAGKNSALSMLLNLTDGLLGEALGIQIIVTFNTNPASLDKALLRKGRLIALYEFKPLAVEKTNILLRKMVMTECSAHGPMTLADIFHARDESFQFNSSRNAIGFLANAV